MRKTIINNLDINCDWLFQGFSAALPSYIATFGGAQQQPPHGALPYPTLPGAGAPHHAPHLLQQQPQHQQGPPPPPQYNPNSPTQQQQFPHTLPNINALKSLLTGTHHMYSLEHDLSGENNQHAISSCLV